MKKIFYLFFALMCMMACTEKNTPSNPDDNTPVNPGDNPGDNPGGQKALLLLPRESISHVKQHDQTGEQRTHIKYQYNDNYDLVRKVTYGISDELKQEEDYVWVGNKQIGSGKVYTNGSVTGEIKDTTEYIDNKHILYSRLSSYYWNSGLESWTVNSYIYNESKLINYKSYSLGKLYSEMNYSYSGNYRYGIGNNYDNLSGNYDTDTTLLNENGLISNSVRYSFRQDGSGNITKSEYTYLMGATVFEQQTSYRQESKFYNTEGQVYINNVFAHTYTWKGDSIRYGVSPDGISTDTTYYYVIYR